jgi:DNA-binding CsgD family transcriptional regulator
MQKRSGGLEVKNRALGSDVEAHVHIFGPLKLQNELMCEFLERSTGLKCSCWEDPVQKISDIKTERNSLILWDCVDTDAVSLWSRLEVGLISQSFLALFNVSPNLRIHREAVTRGVRGVFFENENPEVLTKGVQAILNGELWFSRDILAKCLLETGDSPKVPQEAKPRLTSREKEILIMVASGRANNKIAEELCISLHTVKTHIYNIYKKINAPNRFQAALWAAKNL